MVSFSSVALFFSLLIWSYQSISFAIEFRSINLTVPDGSDFSLQGLVAVEFVTKLDPLTLLVGSYLGTIHLLRISHVSPYKYVARELDTVTVPDGRNVLGITSDPFTPNVFFVPTTILGFTARGLPQSEWDNGQIYVLKVDGARGTESLKLLSDPLITGLPVANSTLGTGLYTVEVGPDGKLFISQGLHTNMGVAGPPDYQEDSFYSGAILSADVRTPGKTLKIEWDSDKIISARPKNIENSGVSLYATGFRTVFEQVITTRGELFVNDGGGAAYNGPKSVSCEASVPAPNAPDRQIRVRRGRWYGSANRARGIEDPQYCVHLWGDETNLTSILKKYPDFNPPIFTTDKASNSDILGSGTFGFLQYLPNWFPYLRKKFIATEYDLTEPNKGRPLPIMYGLDLWRGRLFKLADAPGVSTAVDRYGSVFVGQLNVGKVAIAVPVVRKWMRRKEMIRNVWPSRGKPGTEIWIIGTRMSEARIEIEGQRCIISKRRRYLNLQLTTCVVPTIETYSKTASDVRVGDLVLTEAFTVLPPDVNLEYLMKDL